MHAEIIYAAAITSAVHVIIVSDGPNICVRGDSIGPVETVCVYICVCVYVCVYILYVCVCLCVCVCVRERNGPASVYMYLKRSGIGSNHQLYTCEHIGNQQLFW